ncbi:hypothetical protein [Parapedobacter tibetensis]|uniref:hypothetical protein n=1 Tax=Parapedobacter tibetensis TaxID=2972951 RepID=UPI00214D55DB|nr:hypothetical protein [Parapedobacter tibetensis]
MKKIGRNTFIRQLGLGASLGYVALNRPAFAVEKVFNPLSTHGQLMQRLVKANDEHVGQLLELGDKANRHGGRSLGYNFAKMAAAYCHPESVYHQRQDVVDKLEEIIARLFAVLRPDGTINAGNLESPPDTAFIMEPLCSGAYILSQSKSVALVGVKASIKEFIRNVGEALRLGGVHTPNHRWEICSALAWINALYPNQGFVDRIDDWLGEGIFIDEDGHYPERSMNYADVENRAFLTIGRLLGRPELYQPVIQNLEATYYYMEPNGDLVTVDSRRQDQYSSRSIVMQYLHYRYLAIVQHHSVFSAIADLIEQLPDFEEQLVNESLFHFMANPALAKELPPPTYPDTVYEKVFVTSSLARIRRNETSATIFGGVDWPLIIASGRSVSPNFFMYRKGKAILKHMRMSSRFFSMGHFRSEGLRLVDGKYVLHKKQEAYYFQPLPADERNPEGDYALTPSTDNRFWSKMAFDKRPVSNVKTLESTVQILEEGGNVTLDITVEGQEQVAVTIELCFEKFGKLTGVEKVYGSEHDYFLNEGYGQYDHEGDRITFGPGEKQHEWIRGLDGEQYGVHFGGLPAEGQRVFITGYTPFSYSITFS